MRELVLTRHNELIDPVLRVWGWEIPAYLFLGGWVAGMMIITGYLLMKGRHRERLCSCGVLPVLGLVLLSLGMVALFLDLEHKRHVWRLYTTFQVTSPMSWGAWILVLVYPALAVSGALKLPMVLADYRGQPTRYCIGIGSRCIDPIEMWSRPADVVSRALERWPAAPRVVGSVNLAAGVALGIYTGILLGALGARPLWNSAVLGILFLLSGLSSAAAFVHLIARDRDEREGLARADNVFLAAELVVLALFLIGLLTGTEAHVAAARLVLGGPYTAVFWVFVVGIGLVIPLAFQSLAVRHLVRHTAVMPILVMAGGLALRLVIVYAGQDSHW
jgi:formate-dependent nitrite reductase membrane component NrfD